MLFSIILLMYSFTGFSSIFAKLYCAYGEEKNTGNPYNRIVLVKADWQRTFIGTIRRETDVDGNPVVMGDVIVKDGKIWSKASNQE